MATDVSQTIQKFVKNQRELLNLELQSEQEQEDDLRRNSPSDKSDERASHILGNLDVSEWSVGLYGRTVVELSVWEDSHSSKGSKLLPAHRFTVGDEVEIRSSQGAAKDAAGGVISAVSDVSVHIALFSKNNNNNNNNQQSKKPKQPSSKKEKSNEDSGEGDSVGPPPLRLLPKSSVEINKKLVASLSQLEKHGVNHEPAGGVIRALFDPNHPVTSASSRKSPQIEPFNTNLDASQIEAISFALEDDRRVALVHGPPGTGKTTTIAELIRQAVQVRKLKVLVTAPSNVAVDNILERLVQSYDQQSKVKTSKKKEKSQSKLRAIRLGHPARIKSSILSYSLEAMVQNAEGTEIVADVRKELQSNLRILAHPKSRGNDKRKAYQEMKMLRKEVREREEKVVKELLSTAQVILATTVGAANRILDKTVGKEGFDLVIIDEAAQALEASCWIPALRGSKLVLAGDHCQLPPTIKSRHKKAQDGLSVTMFERLMRLYGDDDHSHAPKVSRMLKTQYRMHKSISDWASTAMYGGDLQTHESVSARLLSQLPCIKTQNDNDAELASTVMLLVDTSGCDMYDTTNAGGSRYNEGEARLVSLHVRKLLELGMKQEMLAIITPYNGQVELLRGLLLPEFPKLEIRSVDGFQGGEKEAVILSLVRSSDRSQKGGIGFLKDDRRQNVAVTRAKRHIAVVCDTDTVSESNFIRTLIEWIEKHGDQRSAMEFDPEHIEVQRDLLDAEAELVKMVQQDTTPAPQRRKKESSESLTSALDKSKRSELMQRIAKFYENGATGDRMVLGSDLSKLDRKLVHVFAEQQCPGLAHTSDGVEGIDRKIILTIERKAKSVAPVAPAITNMAVQENGDGEPAESSKPTPIGSNFALLNVDSSDSEESESPPDVVRLSENTVALQAKTNDPPISTNQILAEAARERAERQKEKASQTKTAPAVITKKPSIAKKSGKRLGGKKQEHKVQIDDTLDDLDDMAFLDAQIDKAQNAHGRKVAGSGKGYRTIVNGILNAKPEPRKEQKNVNASAALKSKLAQAKEGRKRRPKKK